MLKAALFTILSAASLLVLAGCESHQAKVDRLQKEYDQLAAQFQQDCSAEYLQSAANAQSRNVKDEDKTDEAGMGLNFRPNALSK